MKPYILGLVFATAIVLPPLAHADATSIKDPVTDTLNLWSEIAEAVSAITGDIASVFNGHGLAASNAQRQPASTATAAGAFAAAEQAAIPATSSPFEPEPAGSTPTIVNNYITNPIEKVIDQEPLTTTNFVTQSELAATLLALSNAVSADLAPPASPAVPEYVAAGGNPANPFAASNAIDNLSNVTISNPTISSPTITGGSVDAASLSGTITNTINSSVGTIATLSGTNLTYTAATATNATSTDLYASNLSAGTLSVSATTTLAGLKFSATNCSTFGNGGKLTTDALGNVTCAADQGGSGSTVGGADTQVQFNSGGSFTGSSAFTFASSSALLTVPNASTTNLTASYASSSKLVAGNATSTDLFATLANFTTGIISTLSGTSLTYTAASTTNLSNTGTAYFGATATTTIDSAGNLSVAGNATLQKGFLSQASSTVVGTFTTTGTNAFTGASNFTGLGTWADGFLSQASSTVVGPLTLTGTLSAQGAAFTGTTSTTTIAAGQGFTVGGSQFVVQQGSANVGIGTSSPDAALSVVGSGHFTSSLAIGGNFLPNSSNSPVFHLGTNQNFNISSDYLGLTSGITLGNVNDANTDTIPLGFSASKYDFANGNVGIGTTNPGSKLEVEGTVAAQNFDATSTTATSTFADGVNLTGGCFAAAGNCLTLNSFAGTLGVANGGTGWSNIAAQTLLTGNGTGAVATTTIGSGLSLSAGSLGIASGYVRQRLTSNVTYYVSTTGSDSNGCLTLATACATVEHVIGIIDDVDLAGNDVTIQLSDGTYHQSITPTPYVGRSTQGHAPTTAVLINGDASNPSAVLIQPYSGNAVGAVETGGLEWDFQNLEVDSTSSDDVIVDHGAWVVFNNVIFGATTGNQITAEYGGLAELWGPTTVAGSANCRALATYGGKVIFNSTDTMQGDPNFSSAFACAYYGGLIEAAGANFSGAATGKRWLSYGGGIYNTNGVNPSTLFPGTSAGTENFGIASTSPTETLEVNGQSALENSGSLGLSVNEYSTHSGGTFSVAVGYSGGNSQYGMEFDPSSDNTQPIQFENASGTTVGDISQTSSGTAYNTTSDRRLKENIATTTAGLATLMQIPVVDFNFINDRSQTRQQGFIAQWLYPIYPEAVATSGTPATGPLGTSTPWSVDYGRLTPLIVSAIQDIANISNTFEQNLIAWLGNAQNGIAKLFAGEVDAGKLCAQKADGTYTCVTGDQLAALLSQTGAAATSESVISSNPQNPSATSTESVSSTTPPQIQINGDNPAIIQVGATYNDLGAIITGPQADLNLGIQAYLNGSSMSPIQIDTSQAATDTIDYVVTDQNGLTSTSTRTVIIEAPSIVPSDDASIIAATTTDATTPNATTTAATSTSS